MAYDFTISYKPTAQRGNADGLSRLPAGPDLEFDDKVDNCNRVIEDVNDSFPVQATHLAKATTKDWEFSRVWRYIQGGLPGRLESSEESLRRYYERRHMLTFLQGVILLDSNNSRVVIPQCARKYVLSRLDEGH
ncbi:hypothetical protein TTRE_0000068201 [Trichuris trichiura]|uniref:Uncharacterized protein n=1 Tax=Trichuris trichiura TaxID=36087 RepID=A0A077YY90_TRITR|nr:hypothetical protein TTRE_0000068201 [Trichuris trichiura]